MAELIRTADWHPTLGAPEEWPRELQTLVSLQLNTPTPMWLAWGRELRMVYNDAYAEMLGGLHPRALGAPLSEVWLDIWPQVGPLIERTLAGQPQHFEDVPLTIHRNGTPESTWFSFSYSPIHLGDSVAGVFCSMQETTRDVQAREKAAREQERVEELFMQMPGVLAVVRGPDHVFEIANEPMRRLYGHRPLIGRTVRDALPEMLEQGFVKLLDQVYASGEGVEGKAVAAMVPSASQQGVERRYFDFVYQPVRDAQGRVTGIFSQGVDVTEAALATQKLQESERLFRLMADVVPQIIWITDREGRNEFFNQQWQEYTGQPHDPMSSAADVASKFVHPDDVELTLQRSSEARRLGTTFSVEHRIRRADGQYRWFLVRAEPLRDPQTGEVVRWFGSSTDISALKDAERALREADRRKDEFLATLAHELRNPLAPVSNAIAILRSPQAQDGTRTRMLDLMERQTRHLVRLVDDLLEVSRITRGKIELRLERVDLRPIAQACVDAAASAIQEARHDVSLRVPAQPLWVRADPARMKQVIDNLLNNAIKYTPPGGAIELEVSQADGRGCISIQDNGAGIPPEMLDSVFELFAQVDRTIGRAKGGLGIGLALVKQLVRLHDGEVKASSAGIDAGSTFSVLLPLAQPIASSPDKAAPDRLVPTDRPRRVLIIDDNRDAADTMAAAIEICGHTAQAVYDGPGGLAAADRLRPDCILLDVGMPGMNGHQVARALRDNPAHSHCLIVAVTGWGQSQDRAMTRESGFDAHLVKPASMESVMELLEGA